MGYTGEGEEFPQPTISGGLISRLREWEAIGMTYLQTDAALAGGQSGGVLVSENGDVIGISGLFFTEAFGLVASSGDVLPRVERMIAGDDVSGLGDRRVLLEGGRLEHELTLDNDWYFVAYVVNEPAGTEISAEVVGDNDAGLFLLDAYGNSLIYADDTLTGAESGSAATDLAAPYFLLVAQNEETSGSFQVSSNRILVPYQDVDDRRQISVGQTILANVDYPFDFDYFEIELTEGDVLDITVDSALLDPLVKVDFPGATVAQVLSDDNSGGGLFGTNAKLTYRAPQTGTYSIIIQDAVGNVFGGYVLTVSEAPPGAAAVSPPDVAPVVTVDSPFGPMAVYESAQYPFSIQYPADWTEQEPPADVTPRFYGPLGSTLLIGEAETSELGVLTLTQFVDLTLDVLQTSLSGYELVSREQIVTAQGIAVEEVEFTAYGGTIKQRLLFYLHEGTIGFIATYTASTARHEELAPMIDYSFGTFEVEEPASAP